MLIDGVCWYLGMSEKVMVMYIGVLHLLEGLLIVSHRRVRSMCKCVEGLLSLYKYGGASRSLEICTGEPTMLSSYVFNEWPVVAGCYVVVTELTPEKTRARGRSYVCAQRIRVRGCIPDGTAFALESVPLQVAGCVATICAAAVGAKVFGSVRPVVSRNRDYGVSGV